MTNNHLTWTNETYIEHIFYDQQHDIRSVFQIYSGERSVNWMNVVTQIITAPAS